MLEEENSCLTEQERCNNVITRENYSFHIEIFHIHWFDVNGCTNIWQQLEAMSTHGESQTVGSVSPYMEC